ncbi:MAG: ABC transporter permease DevC [Xenococcaceae cyanobacterium]
MFKISRPKSILPQKTHLAWLQLSHQKIRLLVAITGVAFSNILIFTQLGLRALLFEGITLVPENLNGDLFLLSKYAPNIGRSSFPRVYLYQAEAINGITTASPLYISQAEWVDPDTLKSDNNSTENDNYSNDVRILAFNTTQPVFKLPEIDRQLDKLNNPDGVLFDRLGQEQLGEIPQLLSQQEEVITLMDRQRIRVVGLFSMGSTVSDEGHVIMNDWNYGRLKGKDKLETVSVGVLTLESGVNPQQIIDLIRNNLGNEVKVLTREELIQGEQDYIAQFPEGKILNFGAIIGFIVGVVIVYQVLYTDVSEHLPEYATLKAMGYSDRALLVVVLQEALILAILGFIPGFFASYGVYQILEVATRIPLVMRANVAIQVFILTIVMCILSGSIAVNKLRAADPADIY